MRTDPTIRAVTDTMRARVAGVVADPRLVGVAQVRARRLRHRDAAAVALAATCVAAVAGVAVADRAGTGRPGPRPSAAARDVPHARYAPATLPPGFEATPFTSASEQMPPQEDGRLLWQEVLNYGRDLDPRTGPKAVIIVTTVTGDVLPISLASYGDTEPGAKVVVVGGRTVVHVRNALAESKTGLDVYEWTEAPGVNISVIGMGDVTDAEVRAFITALRRVQ